MANYAFILLIWPSLDAAVPKIPGQNKEVLQALTYLESQSVTRRHKGHQGHVVPLRMAGSEISTVYGVQVPPSDKLT